MRVALFLLCLPVALALAAVPLGVHTPFVVEAGERALAKVEARTGLEVRAARVAPDGLLAARVDGLRVGPIDAPVLTIGRVVVELDGDAAADARVEPRLVRVERPTVHIHGDGTVEGALKALRDLAASLRGEPSDGDGGAGLGARRLPAVVVDDGQLLDHSGGVHLVHGRLTLVDGRTVSGSVTVRAPPLGRCRFTGDLHGLDLSCEKPVDLGLPGGLSVEGRRARLALKPSPRVQLPKLELSGDEGPFAELVRGWSVELAVGLRRDVNGRWPIEVRLGLPGGGSIVGDGTADRDGLRVTTDVERMPIAPAAQQGGAPGRIQGLLSADVRVSASVPDQHAEVSGEARVDGLRVEHPALAEGPVGPFDLSISGKLTAEVPPDRELRAVRVELEDGMVASNGVSARLDAVFDNTGEAPRIRAEFAVPKVPGQQLLNALPRGLLAHVWPMEVKGDFSMRAHLDIDMTRLKQTKLDVDLGIRGLQVRALSPEIDLDALRNVFETHFEMPDGEIISRVTGPESERWTPLEEIPALMPLAVITQEDGGFYRHPGVSLLHLRGSLIRNLERGRFARGGSTVTMQLARNLFLNRRKTLSRKLEELIVTWLLEKEFTKDELIELYLNVVEFGPGVFGIGDAANYYFEKSPIELTPTEMVFLTRLLPAPRRYHAQFEDGEVTAAYAKRMRRLIDLLVDRGHLDPERGAAADPMMLWKEPPPVDESALPVIPLLPDLP